jgi:NADP-dependent 3-hydroxy acid dehydrogenase YdfG
MGSDSLKGKVAFITGASDGMGKATSFYLSSLGADVILAARRFEVVGSFADEIKDHFGTNPLPLKVDVAQDNDVKAAIANVLKRFGRLDLIVNFAGNPVGYASGDRKKPVYELSVAHMKEIAEVDHFGSVRILKYALPQMIRQGTGMIILISAITSVYGYSEDVDYIPYKRANEGLATSTALRSERDGWGVRLYTLAPGDVFNPSTWNVYSDEEKRESLKYGVIESLSVSKIVSWLFSGRLKERFDMRMNIDTGEVIDEGRYIPIRNGDIIVVDAKTVPKLFESVGENYRVFVPEGY